MIQSSRETISALYKKTTEYVFESISALNEKVGHIALYALLNIPDPKNLLINKCIKPVLNYFQLKKETQNYILERINRCTKEIFILIAVAFSIKRYPNKLVLGTILGTVFPDLVMNATTKFWNDIFCTNISEKPINLKKTETKIIWLVGIVFYKIQPAIIATAIGYFTYPAATEIFPVAIGARLAASGFRSDFFLKLTNQDQKIKRNRSLSL